MTQRSDRRQSEVVLLTRIILNVYANNDAETQRYSHRLRAQTASRLQGKAAAD